jgi:hypothetical protein
MAMKKPVRALGWLGVALVGAACLVGCGGGSPVDPVPAGVEGALVQSRPGDLLAYAKEKLSARQAARVANPAVLPLPSLDLAGAGAVGAPAAATEVLGTRYSGTAVQEQGVDEDDLIKTDGSTIVTLVRTTDFAPGKPWAKVQLHRRRSDGGIDFMAGIALPPDAQSYALAQGLYFLPAARVVAVLSESQALYTLDVCGALRACNAANLVPLPPIYAQNFVWLDLVDTAAAAVSTRVRLQGRLVGSRLIGSSLVLVTQHAPQLGVEVLPAEVPQAERQALIDGLATTDLLPTISRDGGTPVPMLPETDCLLQPKNASLGLEITTITVFDLSSPELKRTSRCFVGGSEALYMAPTSMYLATTRYAVDPSPMPLRWAPDVSTDIHKFALSATAIDYRGSGAVQGHLGWDPQKNPHRLGEFNGDLRVLTYNASLGWVGPASASDPSAPPPSPATLSILRENASDKTLQRVGKLPNAKRPEPLGKPGEQVYAVRLLGERGYVVTFRRSDPLYVLDLSDPTDPKTVGELQAAGFSDYLFPLGDGLLLGVGKDASSSGVVGGVKVALIDAADPTKPREAATQTFGAAGSISGLDASRHGIDLYSRVDTVRVGLPLLLWTGALDSSRRGLQRLEIDRRSRTMTTRPMIDAANSAQRWDLSNDRSVQIDAQVYYFADGQLSASDW